MEKIQEVPTFDLGPIFDAEQLQKVHDDDDDDDDYDDYNVFASERQHHKQPKSVNDTYFVEQGDTNITSDSSDMSNNGEKVDQDDQMLQKEHELLASLIEQMKIEIDASKQNNKALESSNKSLKEAKTFLHTGLKRKAASGVLRRNHVLGYAIKNDSSQGQKGTHSHHITNDDYVAPATKSILDKLLEESGDEILNVTMDNEEADFNPTKDLEELERLLVEEPQSNFTKIQEADLEHGLEHAVSSYHRANPGE
ncbi:hypothetical protein Tco_1385877 [Tanacetum coccineum]